MNWSANLEFAPVPLPDGRKLVTLDDARAYLAVLPKRRDKELRPVAKAVLTAAERPNQFYLHCARQAVSRAVWGDERPEPRERKVTWRDKRRARS